VVIEVGRSFRFQSLVYRISWFVVIGVLSVIWDPLWMRVVEIVDPQSKMGIVMSMARIFYYDIYLSMPVVR
jgi:hypothetical protein